MSRLLLSVIVFLAVGSAVAGLPPLRTTGELRMLLLDNRRINVPFALEGVVGRPPTSQHAGFTLLDDTGGVLVYRGRQVASRQLQAGDRIAVSGETSYYNSSRQHIYARCDKLKVLSHGEPPVVIDVRISDLADGRHDFRTVRLQGLVRNAFPDEIDPFFAVLIVNDGGVTIPVLVRTDRSAADLDGYIGAEVRVIGLCNTLSPGSRLNLGRIITTSLGGITVLRTPEKDVFAVPDASVLRNKPASEIVAAGRHKAVGRVVTRWAAGKHLILETADGDFVNAELSGAPVPDLGQTVEVSGMPETDLFRINLSRSAWRPSRPIGKPSAHARPATIQALFSNTTGLTQIQTQNHGHALTVEGAVRNLIVSPSGERRLVLEDGGRTLPVDISVCTEMPPPDIGARVRITGTCVIEADMQRTLSSFSRIRDVFLVVNHPADLVLLSAAPFWSPARLGTVIGTLGAVLLGILIWNLSLRTIVRRKTRELENEIARGLEAELRIHERTRLATELHDSISQNLTGVALALDEVGEVLPSDGSAARVRLDIATRTLKSCRGELRNCLWDLRSEALEEPEIDTAIRRTLAPHVRDTNLAIRFRAARESFSDNTLHTILCIIRELTVNAIRHGNAKNVKIAGSIENGELRFSVADDGCGFDPESRPDITTGHFGLQGVQERAESLGGSVEIRSQPDKGSKITISIKLKTATNSRTSCPR